jgi:hypothetical protein
MKMGNRRLKKLDRLGVRVIDKPHLTDQPRNRQERRAAKHWIKKSQTPKHTNSQAGVYHSH